MKDEHTLETSASPLPVTAIFVKFSQGQYDFSRMPKLTKNG